MLIFAEILQINGKSKIKQTIFRKRRLFQCPFLSPSIFNISFIPHVKTSQKIDAFVTKFHVEGILVKISLTVLFQVSGKQP